jgi:mycothiol synthase
MDDLEAVVDLLNACSIEAVGKAQTELYHIRNDWESPIFDVTNDTCVVALGGEIVSYASIWDDEPHVRIHLNANVHPGYTGRGIGTALCEWGERRARQSILKTPQGTRVVLLQHVISTNEKARALFLEQGYQLVRHGLRMVIDLDERPPEPVVPEGIHIRPYVRGEEERAVMKAAVEAFRDHWGFVDKPFEMVYEEWTHWLDNDPNFDPSLWLVAMDGEDIAGMALCIPKTTEDPAMGWIDTLGVLRPWRRRGLGLALLLHIFGEFYRRGKLRVGLGVDAENLTGALRLYEKAGMYVSRQYDTYEKELRAGTDLSTQSL